MSSLTLKERSETIKKLARETGFDLCGISKAQPLEKESGRLGQWLSQGMHGEMAYMTRNKDKRLDPVKLVEGAKSVISLIHNYYPSKNLFEKKNYKIARYAYGKDYHFVIKKKLIKFIKVLEKKFGAVNGRVFVDSAPVMERQWAAKAGLGWTGKNTLLLNRSMGSYFFLAEAITDLELQPDHPVKDYCGSCTKCIDACPTSALSPYKLDARRCISYLTIELKNDIPPEFKGKYNDWIFGCDVCQEVCPWNRFSKPHNEPEFEPDPELERMNEPEWNEITEEIFRKLFRKSAVKRSKFTGLKRNISFLKN